jgi:ABC-type molybdate transport system substrate-binding protein
VQRFDLPGNRLVLIGPKGSRLDVKIAKNFPLATILGNEKLAMGDPDHVPPGICGKKALEALGVWKSAEPDQGAIVVNGRPVFDSSRGLNLSPEARRFGFVFQDGRLFPHMS